MSSPAMICERDFQQLTDLIRLECGIDFPPSKRIMIETRLGKRAHTLGLASLTEYCQYLRSNEGRRDEALHLIHEVTTHKTDFFREPGQFTYLAGHAAPELRRLGAGSAGRPMRVWSSACSTGEEPYTIAMTLADHAKAIHPERYSFQIDATDISAEVLKTAELGIYPAALADPIPLALKREYLMRSKNRDCPSVRIVPSLRAAVRFRRLNLLDPGYGFKEPLDVVFCRNVLIYFDRAAQYRILSQVVRTLRPGGYLIVGHAESLNGMDLPIEAAAPAIYRRADD